MWEGEAPAKFEDPLNPSTKETKRAEEKETKNSQKDTKISKNKDKAEGNFDNFPSSSDFSIAEYANPDDANIVLGEKLWKQHCNRCHNLRSTKDFDPDEWRAIMAHMKVRACLPDEIARVILQYLVYSATPPDPYPMQSYKVTEYAEITGKEDKTSEKDSEKKEMTEDDKKIEKLEKEIERLEALEKTKESNSTEKKTESSVTKIETKIETKTESSTLPGPPP